jgi:hypothetical protein
MYPVSAIRETYYAVMNISKVKDVEKCMEDIRAIGFKYEAKSKKCIGIILEERKCLIDIYIKNLN